MMGPPAPPTYHPNQMIGRNDESSGPRFKEMMPLLIAGLADLVSTEAMTRSGGREGNPILKPFSVKGSYAPVLGVGYGLEALLLHMLSKKKPGLANLLKTGQTAASGTLAGQNFTIPGNPAKDDRIAVWQRGKY